MSLDVESRKGTPTPPRRSRARWIVVAVAVAVVVVAAVSSLVLWLGEDDSSDNATPPVPSSATPGTTTPSDATSQAPTQAPTTTSGITRLTLGPEDARCLVPSAAGLRSAALAFEGTVAKIGPRAVLLDVSSWLHADGFGGTNTVRVARPPVTTDSPVTFEAGKTYLVAATGDAKVMACGYSGVRTPDLAKLYSAAF